MTRQEAITHKDAIVAFADGKPIEMRGPDGGRWFPTSEPGWLPDWEYREAQRIYTVVLEDMLAACIPGGDFLNPQEIADSIRAYCRKEAAL